MPGHPTRYVSAKASAHGGSDCCCHDCPATRASTRRKVENLNTNGIIITLAHFAQLLSPFCRLYPTLQSRKRPTSPHLCHRPYMNKTVCALMVCTTSDQTFYETPLPPFRSIAKNFPQRKRRKTHTRQL